MVIWLASYPRSGNTFFRVLLKHFYGINSYSFYEDKELEAQPEVCRLVGHLTRQKPLKDLIRAEECYFVKTHELPHDEFPAIYLVRDGRDVLLSYTWYILNIVHPDIPITSERFWKTLHSLIIDNDCFGAWGPHVLAWTQRQAPTAIIKFDELIHSSNPLHIVKQAIHNVTDYEFSEVTASPPPTFSTLHQHMPKFFRKGQVDSWRKEMPPKLHDLFWETYEPAMRVIGHGTTDRTRYSIPFEQRIISEERERGMTELCDIATQRLQLLGRYDNELTITEKLIQTQQEELVAKEQLVQKLSTLAEERFQLIRQLELHPLRALLKKYLPNVLVNVLRQIRSRFQPKLGQLRQYTPAPLKLPEHYTQSHKLSQQALPMVLVVTPSLNQAQFLEQTIKSVLDQHYPRLEYIIQDGASTDATGSILQQYAGKVTYIESAKDTGQANAINRGFCYATGDIMAWLNSDDLLLPGALTYIANFFLEHPDVDVVYGHRIIINDQGHEIGRWILPPHDKNMLLWADYVPQETLFWRREIWERAGGYIDESFHFALDWELLLRFRETKARFVRLPRFLAAFRVHPQQKTSQELATRGCQEMARLRKRIHGREVSNLEAHHQIRHYMRKHVAYDWLYRLGVFRF